MILARASRPACATPPVQAIDRRGAPPPCHPYLADPQALRVIRRQVQRHTLGVDLARNEREDLVQDQWLQAHERFSRYDPTKGASLAAFLALIVRDGVRTWLRDRDRQCRTPRRLVYVETLAPEDPSRAPLDSFWEHDLNRRELRGDLAIVMSSQGDDARRMVASLVANEHDFSRARRSLGWSRVRFEATRAVVCRACALAGLAPGARP